MILCRNCDRAITSDDYDVWSDADAPTLVYCTDQDETHDGIRHTPAVHAIDCDLDGDCSCGLTAREQD